MSLLQLVSRRIGAADIAWGNGAFSWVDENGIAHTASEVNASYVPTTYGGSVDSELQSIATSISNIPSLVATYPEFYGAVGDGVADDADAINDAADAARLTTYKRIVLQSGSGYNVSKQLDLTGLSISGNSFIYSTFDSDSRVICGDGISLDISLHVSGQGTRAAGTDGVLVRDVTRSRIYIDSLDHDVGIRFQPTTDGFIGYNHIMLGRMENNNTGVLVYVTGAGDASANANIVYGGNIGVSAGLTTARCAIELLSDGTQAIDSWIFYGPSMEMVYTGTVAGIITKKASNCTFHDVRWESGAGVPIARFEDYSINNKVDCSVVSPKPGIWQCGPSTDTYGVCGCEVRHTGETALNRLTDYHGFNSAYSDGTYFHVPGYQFNIITTGSVARKSNGTWYLTDGYGGAGITGTTSSDGIGIGITVDFSMAGETAYFKNIKLITKYYGSSSAIRVGVSCFDANGAALHGVAPAYAQGSKWSEITSGSYYRYLMLPYLPNTGDININIHPSVIKARISVWSGEPIHDLQIYCSCKARGYLEYAGVQEAPGKLYAANAPTKWHFQIGDIVHNEATGLTGAVQGWRCNTRADTTLNGAASAGTSAITAASTSNMATGHILGVKLDTTGRYHFTTVSNLPGASVVTLGAVMPSDAASGNAVVANSWINLPNFP